VGTAATVKDTGPVGIDLVAILDPDRALSRPGLEAGQRALAAWMEAAAWAGDRDGEARVLVQTRQPGHPAVQALIRWEPEPYLRAEGEAASRAGFPPGHPVFRIEGPVALQPALEAATPESALFTAGLEGTVCLVAVHPDRLAVFREHVLRLASEGLVRRVEAEPQL
jgi:primosomal protein N'